MSDAADLAFGRFRVDRAARAVSIDGEPAKLGGRAFDLLVALAERRERIVGRQELFEVVWPRLVVDDNNLRVHVAALRKLLGPDVIATIPGRGYRFTARLDGEAPHTAPTPHAATPHMAGNLPVELPPLYGRDADLAAVRRLVEAHRLVTVAGAGGIGKTRVGQAVAYALRGAFADGVWLVELAPLADAGLLPAAVAQALQMQLRGVRELREELVDALQSQALLLVLDNCEHLIGEVSVLAQALLRRTPQVRVLVTSQEPLKLPGEHVFRLDPLGVPPPAADAASALQHGAVQLFVERVQALDRRFAIDERNAAAVIDIVRRLDGLPLAVELAAARVPALGVGGVRERLQQRLRVLTGGPRGALQRYQTLRAALDWSYHLLDADEQTVFRRFGVFCGGCTIEAAQEVAAGPVPGRSQAGPAPSGGREQSDRGGQGLLDEWAVLDIVARLIDKSLVVADGDDRPRYRLLESARAYALEKLAEAGESDALARRHATHFAQRFERLADDLYRCRLSDDGFLAPRAAELDNLRAAIGWALSEPGDTALALALLAHSAPMSLTLPLHDESERWCDLLAARVAAAAPSPAAAAWNAYVQVHWRMLRLRGVVRGREAPLFDLFALRRLPDEPRRGHTLYYAALHASWIGDLAGARALAAEADALDRSGWPAWLRQFHTYMVVRTRHLAGDATSNEAELQGNLRELAAAGEGDSRTSFVARTELALDALVQERFELGLQRLEALVAAGRRQRRDSHRMSVLSAHWVLALAELGRFDDALAAAREALPWLRRTGLWGVYAPVFVLLAARRGDARAAARLLGAGDAQLARSGLARSLLERRAGAQALQLLHAACDAQQAEHWIAEGAALDEDAFAQLSTAG